MHQTRGRCGQSIVLTLRVVLRRSVEPTAKSDRACRPGGQWGASRQGFRRRKRPDAAARSLLHQCLDDHRIFCIGRIGERKILRQVDHLREVGVAQGPKGVQGPPGPIIAAWEIDYVNYRARAIMSDGSVGGTLDLRGMFEHFHREAR